VVQQEICAIGGFQHDSELSALAIRRYEYCICPHWTVETVITATSRT